MIDEHPLYDRRVQVVIGLLGPTVIGIFGLFLYEGIVRWTAFAIAVIGAIVMPYALRVALENTNNVWPKTTKTAFRRRVTPPARASLSIQYRRPR